MLVVVKTLHTKFTIEGSIPKRILNFIKAEYGEKAHVINNDQYINVSSTERYKKMKAGSHPGQALRSYRQNANLTQQVIADVLEVSKARISDYENGHREMSKEVIKKVAKYFKIPIERLL